METTNRAPMALVLAAALFLSSTGSKPKLQPHARPAIATVYAGTNKPSAEEEKWVVKNCRFGLPKPRAEAPIGPTRRIFREGFVLEHSSELRIPLWVCESLTKDDLAGPEKKRLDPEPFHADVDLEKRWPHARLRDYDGSGFARGHMSPDANRTKSKADKHATYTLANMVPQAGQKFNSSVWRTLEDRVRSWAGQAPCWIVTGVLIHDPREENPATATGIVEYYAVGKTPVGIPTHLFKIILAEKAKDRVEALAFIFDNKSYEKGETLEKHVTSIAWIEHRAGFDFFPDMPKDEVKRLKDKIAAELWPTK